LSKSGPIARWNEKLGQQLEKTIIGRLTGGVNRRHGHRRTQRAPAALLQAAPMTNFDNQAKTATCG
jgi:hypothetical protein